MSARPVIVTAKPPKRIRRRKAARPLRMGPIVGARKAGPALPEAPGTDDRAEAADRLWRELLRQATG